MDFAELNLRHCGNPERTMNLVRRAVRMGYDAVVINIDIGDMEQSVSTNIEDEQPRKKKQKKGHAKSEQQNQPNPFLVDESKLDLSTLQQAGKKFRQFSRLTVQLTDATSVHKLMHHPKLKLYDVVAVRFEDEQILMTLMRKGEFIDLISIDADIPGKMAWFYKPKVVQACIDAGISLELIYSKALFSSENRRQFFANARTLIEITRGGRGVVLSSGAEEVIALRAPYDTANLCTLFGLDPRHGRKFVSAQGISSEEMLKKLASIPEFEKQLKKTGQSNVPEDVEMIESGG
ncbi:RNase P subunit p30 domain-containing protein [Ditylenchus destructor]|uniref:RNase P subunit p30 domain-containing protein n=1 Tax=Ditylenchus destructor TaxID=166010 RepID=A0AAD4NC72_9BILA|nr:RNase P subunit p30 domain-containing protein [Ditylenchus destructor]